MTEDTPENAPDEFHPDAHEKAREITGERLYGEWGQCVAESRQQDRRCKGPAVGPHGKCYNHGGATPTKDENEDVGAPENNGNAATHNLTSDETKLYKRLDVEMQAHVDNVRDSILDEICRRRGLETPPAYLIGPARRVAMNMVRVVWFAEDWEAKSADDTGNPLVDEQIVDGGDEDFAPTYVEQEGVAQSVASKLSSENRQWLKDFGLMDSPEDRQADAQEDVADAMMESLRGAYE